LEQQPLAAEKQLLAEGQQLIAEKQLTVEQSRGCRLSQHITPEISNSSSAAQAVHHLPYSPLPQEPQNSSQQQHSCHIQQQLHLPRAFPQQSADGGATEATTHQLLLLRRSRRRTMVRTNGSLPAAQERYRSCYYGDGECDGELALPPPLLLVPGQLRALPVIPFWEASSSSPTRLSSQERLQGGELDKKEEVEVESLRSESLDCLIAQARAQLQAERENEISWEPPSALRRRRQRELAATSNTPLSSSVRRRTAEVNQNYIITAPPAANSVYMTMEVTKHRSASSGSYEAAVSHKMVSSENRRRCDSVPPPFKHHSSMAEKSEYIDMDDFPLKR
jgi:hypothetical protein